MSALSEQQLVLSQIGHAEHAFPHPKPDCSLLCTGFSPTLNSRGGWSPLFSAYPIVSTLVFYHLVPCRLSFSGPAALRLMPMRLTATLPMPGLLPILALAVLLVTSC